MTTEKDAPVSDREAAEMAEWLEVQEGKKETAVASSVTITGGIFFILNQWFCGLPYLFNFCCLISAQILL